MVVSELKYRLMSKYPKSDYRIEIVIKYNKKYRRKNGNFPITKGMIDHVLNGRPCKKRALILKTINDIL